jgi:hypothetical protein
LIKEAVSLHVTKELMAQRFYLRAAGHNYNMGRGKEESPRQEEVERNCGCPMSPMNIRFLGFPVVN